MASQTRERGIRCSVFDVRVFDVFPFHLCRIFNTSSRPVSSVRQTIIVPSGDQSGSTSSASGVFGELLPPGAVRTDDPQIRIDDAMVGLVVVQMRSVSGVCWRVSSGACEWSRVIWKTIHCPSGRPRRVIAYAQLALRRRWHRDRRFDRANRRRDVAPSRFHTGFSANSLLN
jgi:hypothetical protein